MKPEFFRDQRLAELPDTVRLFYIGMWMEADDAGWLAWDVPELAADLYPYSSRIHRERWVRERSAALIATGRLVIADCERHAFVPHLVRHQRFGGRPVYSTSIAHAKEANGAPRSTVHAQSGSKREQAGAIAIAPDGRGGKGKGGKGRGVPVSENGSNPSAPAHAREAMVTELRAIAGDTSKPGHLAARRSLERLGVQLDPESPTPRPRKKEEAHA